MEMTETAEQGRLLVVRRLDRVADDIVELTLGDPEGGALPSWQPGAHIDLNLGPELSRQYSILGESGDGWRIAVLREKAGRGGSEFIHDTVREGTILDVTGPRNHFPLVPSERYLFIAGGIGITPIMAMVRQAELADAEWRLVYGGRTLTSMAFLESLRQDFPGKVTAVPQDTDGIIDLDSLLGIPQPGVLVYCCGPEPLLAAVEQRIQAWPDGTLHVERFAPKPRASGDVNSAFEVEIDSTGEVLIVPSDRSVLEVVRAAGVNVVSSCREGTCGTCETGVLLGRPDHRDSILDDDEREESDVMYICVSRSLTPRLVLDL